MSKTRFSQCIALACIATLAACTSGDGDTAGNSQLNVIVPDGGADTIDIGTVEYTIQCDGNSSTFLDNNDSFVDEVLINGNLEVTDSRLCTGGDNPGTSCSTDDQCQGASPTPDGTCDLPDPTSPEIWQAFMDLPPGPCLIQLRATDNDGEVICVADDTFSVIADTTTKINLVLVCNISFQAPVGMLDVDATFSFVVGNFCPDLFVLNCVESNPQPPPIPGAPATTYCEVRYRDGDSTCGNNCDPQTCDNTVIPPVCTPATDPGLSTIVTCDANGLLDCNGDFTFDPSCAWNGPVTGVVGSGIPVPVILGGPGPDRGGFYAGCNPAAAPGAVVTCTAVTTDGDIDCDKTKEVSFNCPGLNFCDQVDPDDNLTDCSETPTDNECTIDSCDRGAQACVNDAAAAAGDACTTSGGFTGACDGAGVCVTTDCNAQPVGFCDDGNVCTTNACEAGGACSTTDNDGVACNGGAGICGGGVCVDNCTGVSCDDGNDCTDDATCDPLATPLCAASTNSAAGTSCDPGGGNPGECDGAGACNAVLPTFISAGTGSTTWTANTTPPGGGTAPTTGGCSVFVTVLNTTIFLEVLLTLDVASDGANNISTGWQIEARNPLLGALGNAAELGALSIGAAATNTTGGPIPSGLNPAVVGQPVGNFYVVPNVGPLLLVTPTEITAGAAALTPTVGVPGNVNINWDGLFALRLDLAGSPLVVVDETVCTFDDPGTGIDFATTN